MEAHREMATYPCNCLVLDKGANPQGESAGPIYYFR